MTTARPLYDDVRNAIDYLVSAELVYYANTVSLTPNRVSWHGSDRAAQFLISGAHPNVDQYVAWVTAGAYTAILFDGSLLQLTYDLEGGSVVGYRLACVPCPFDIDRRLLLEGEPLADVVDLYRSGDAAMRSPIRFDYDRKAAGDGHPAVHLTINATSCRIACAAPLHVLRFVDFVFRHFYPHLWSVHQTFFREAAKTRWRCNAYNRGAHWFAPNVGGPRGSSDGLRLVRR